MTGDNIRNSCDVWILNGSKIEGIFLYLPGLLFASLYPQASQVHPKQRPINGVLWGKNLSFSNDLVKYFSNDLVKNWTRRDGDQVLRVWPCIRVWEAYVPCRVESQPVKTVSKLVVWVWASGSIRNPPDIWFRTGFLPVGKAWICRFSPTFSIFTPIGYSNLMMKILMVVMVPIVVVVVVVMDWKVFRIWYLTCVLSEQIWINLLTKCASHQIIYQPAECFALPKRIWGQDSLSGQMRA